MVSALTPLIDFTLVFGNSLTLITNKEDLLTQLDEYLMGELTNHDPGFAILSLSEVKNNGERFRYSIGTAVYVGGSDERLHEMLEFVLVTRSADLSLHFENTLEQNNAPKMLYKKWSLKPIELIRGQKREN